MGSALLLTGLIHSPASWAVTLQEVVQKTIASSPEVQVNVQERRAREQEIKQARGGYYPTVDLTAGIGTERSNNPSTRAAGLGTVNRTREEAAINLRQMLFDGFLTSSEVERQQARVNSIAYTVDGSAQNTALRAVEVYLELLRRQGLLKLAQDNLDAHQRTYDQILARSKSGVGRKADLDQVEGRRALAQSNVIAEQANLDDAMTNYLRVVGELPADALVRPQAPDDAVPASMEESVNSAVANHPTLKSAEADVQATHAQHQAAKSPFFPRFDLELGKSANNDLDGQDGINNDETIMLRMRYNLLNGGSDYARRRQTAYLIGEAKEVRNRTYRQVIESMRLSWNAYRATDQQLVYLRQYLEAAKRTRDAYQKQFNIGQRTLLDLLDSENELFEARRSTTNADYDRLFAQYRVLNAMGRLVQAVGVELPPEASPL